MGAEPPAKTRNSFRRADAPRSGALDAAILRIVESIAISLAREHHALETGSQGLSRPLEISSDGLPCPSQYQQ